MNPIIENLISRFVRQFVARYYLRITILSVVATALSVWIIATQWNINSDFKALLPQTSDAAMAMEEVGDRVGSGSALFVVVDSPSLDANKEFARVFAERLRELPSVGLAHFYNDKSFYQKHQLLYLETEDLETIRNRIADKIEEEKKKSNPLFASLDDEDEEESDEFIRTGDIRAKYDHLAHRGHREYLVAENGTSLTIIVRFSESSTDLAGTNRLIRKIKDIGGEVGPKTYHEEMELEYGGGLIRRQNEYGSLLGDIRSSALFTLAGLLLVIGLYFRRVRATALVMIPLVMGVAWTLALAFLVFGELTTVTAFIFAILLGLGIDYSIHLLSGYDHARMEGRSPIEALVRTYQGVGSATVIGALTTFATFVVLSFAQFRGLSQFGQVASAGVAFTLAAMIVVLPALVLTFDAAWPHEIDRRVDHDGSIATSLTARKIGQYAPLAISIAVAFTALAITQYPSIAFEENFRKLGEVAWPWERIEEKPGTPRQRDDAREKGEERADDVRAGATTIRKSADPDSFEKEFERTTEEKYKSALKGQRSSTPTVLLFDNPDETQRVTRHMRRLKRKGELDTVLSVASIFAFLPGTEEEQKARIEEIEEIEELLDSEDLSFLEGDEREKLKEFRKKLDVEPVSIYDLPRWTKRLFREAGEGATPATEGEPFAFEYTIYVNEAIDQMRGERARAYLQQIQKVKEEADSEFRIGSQSYIYVQMLDEIKSDGLLMISLALFFVFLLLTAAFRSPLRGLVAMTPLILGASWMFGLLAWLGIKLDFFNVIIIPVVIGIGVDAGVHFYRRYLERGKGSIGLVIRTVGSAVTMATVTTGIGFGGLAITDHGGLSSIGHLAIVGLSTTLVATLLVMPVILWFAETYEIDWLLPRESDLAN